MFILALAAIMGALRYNSVQPRFDSTSLATYNDQQKPVVGEGIVVGEPDARDAYTNLRVEGKLQTPTDSPDFSYREYLARQGVYSLMSRPRVTVLARDQGFAPLAWLFTLKVHAKNVIAQILPEPQASLLTGILLGDDAGVPQSLQEAFRITGTSHILAISGYNGTQTMFTGHTF
jgi:competence protein ComEC